MDNAYKCWPKGTNSTNVSGGGSTETFPHDKPRTKGGTPTNAYVTLTSAKHQRGNQNDPKLLTMRSFQGRLRGVGESGEVPKG